MSNLSKTYNKYTTDTTVDGLLSAFAEMHEARADMKENRHARALIDAACEYQSNLRNILARPVSKASADDALLALNGALTSRKTIEAHITIAAQYPKLKRGIETILSAHEDYANNKSYLTNHHMPAYAVSHTLH